MTEGPARHQLFDQARRRAELSMRQLWLSYLALGGHGDLFDLEAFLQGLATLPPHEQDVLAHALNEELTELYQAARVPYLDLPDPQASEPDEDPLTVLNELLNESTADAGDDDNPT